MIRQCVFLLKDSIVILDRLLSKLYKVSSIICPIEICNLKVLSKLELNVLDDIIVLLWSHKYMKYPVADCIICTSGEIEDVFIGYRS